MLDRRVVTAGRLECGVRGIAVDVDECFDCSHVRAVNEDGWPPFVICAGSPARDPEDGGQVLLGWWLRHSRRAASR